MRRKNGRRSYKKRAYKKRMYKKRSYVKKFTKPDGYHSAKIVQRLSLTVNNNVGLTNTANYTIAWQLPEADMQPAGFFTNGVNCAFDWHTSTNSSSVEWLKLNNLFTQYKVTGMKIKYEPQLFQSSGDKSQQPITVFSVMRGSAFNSAAIALERQEQSLDFKTYNPYRTFQRYYRVSKYLKGIDQAQWIAQGTLLDPETCGQTHVICPTTGFNTGDRIGTLELTYYMKFRLQTGV